MFALVVHLGAQTIPSDGLVGRWTGDNTPNDSSTTGNNGVWNGTATYVAGQTGNAFYFTNSSSYVGITDSTSYNFATSGGTNAFTVGFWFNFNGQSTTSTQATFVGQDNGSSTNDKWFLTYNYGSTGTNGKFNLHFMNASGATNDWLASNSATLNSTSWYHLALTKSGSNYTFYLNGTSIGSVTSDVTFPNPTNPLTLGYAEPNIGFPGGYLDEVVLYNRALSAAEVAGLAAVPEPSTCAALAGLGALGFAAWRRRKTLRPAPTA
jgi:hypothetical protein